LINLIAHVGWQQLSLQQSRLPKTSQALSETCLLSNQKIPGD
jgi:hypothetical protein